MPRRFPDRATAAAKYEHGTRARYQLGGCKCLPCRSANSIYETERREHVRLLWRVHKVGGGYWVVHNTQTRETVSRTKVRQEAFAERDRRNGTICQESDRTLVSTREAVAHIKKLKRAGVGLRRVSVRSGIGRDTLYRIVSGDIRRTRRATAERILAVGPNELTRASLVDAAPTWKLLEHLLELGHRRSWIAKQLGSTSSTPALQIKHDRITLLTAFKVSKLYDLLTTAPATPNKPLSDMRRRLHQESCWFYTEGCASRCPKCRALAA